MFHLEAQRAQLWRWLSITVVLVIALLPILWTALASVNLQPDSSVWPPAWPTLFSLENYHEIRQEQTYFWEQLITSLGTSLIVTTLTVAVALPAAYALARSRFRGRNMLVQGCLLLASVPAISYAIPLGLTLRQWRLFDTVPGVVLAETANLAPLTVFILVGYIVRLPGELEAEAYLNGAGVLSVLWYVILPGVMPGLAASAALVFVLSWNQYVLPLVLSGTHIRVIPVMMRDFFSLEREFEWSKAAAVIVISLLPVSIFVGVAHRLLENLSLNIANIDQ